MDEEERDDGGSNAAVLDLLALILLAAASIIYFLFVPAVVLVWMSARWTVGEKTIATGVPFALLVLALIGNDSSDSGTRVLGILSLASFVVMAFFLAVRMSGRDAA